MHLYCSTQPTFNDLFKDNTLPISLDKDSSLTYVCVAAGKTLLVDSVALICVCFSAYLCTVRSIALLTTVLQSMWVIFCVREVALVRFCSRSALTYDDWTDPMISPVITAD